MFTPVPKNTNFPQLEEEILQFWRERGIYEKSLEQRADAERFVFYEGPPTANGMPHPGHCLTRAIKDLFPRYQTMRGKRCERKGGWDTHGLPVEVEVCKELGIHAKEEIEEYGVEPFIHKCQESVWRYMKEWERMTERIGFWIHLDEAYVTYHQSYVESVWWSLKQLFQKKLLYKGHKIVWWWAQGGTALSSGEVGQGYREVADPSVYVRFPLLDVPASSPLAGASLLVWTTTPWTLPSNQFVAVHPDVEYSIAVDSKNPVDKIVVAKHADHAILAFMNKQIKSGEKNWRWEGTIKGRDLAGLRYTPPFDCYHARYKDVAAKTVEGEELKAYWRVLEANFVTTDSGTGIVHVAPSFGEADHELLMQERNRLDPSGFGLFLFCCVDPDGRFNNEGPAFVRGQWVKDADKAICRDLRARDLLPYQTQYIHDYPFCWRADEDPLIQYPRKSWFIRTTSFKDRMLQNNNQINWLPDHIKEGRMGNFLETNVDWALSRERYWGTPLPIWVCSETGKMEAVASYEELLAKPGVTGTEVWDAAKRDKPELPDDLRVHKPYIDAITYDSPFAGGARMQRVTEVIDCWYDSGAMPFAQWGYPHQNSERFEEQFPANFISEALDQTRGWFYSQMAISTMLFGDENQTPGSEISNPKSHTFPHPFENCIVLGLMLAEGYICTKCNHRHQEDVNKCEECGGNVTRKVEKMSKRLRNYREPQEIFDRYGADALRWYFFANQAPWTSLIYSERTIKESIPEFLLRLFNVYSFFVIYANIDSFAPNDQIPVTDDQLQLTAGELAAASGYQPVAQRGELDRWILSELNRTIAVAVERMDAYDNFAATGAINEFVDALSNWYVRRSRDRFWSGDEQSQEKLDAHWTLYECLLTTSKVVAPFVPFLAETLWRNLTSGFGERTAESVHLCDYPAAEEAIVDELLSVRMQLLREIASLGRSARMESKLKVRQPLAKVEVILADQTHQSWLEEHDALIREELNVKQVEYTTEADEYISYQVVPNFKRLGPRVGKLMPAVKKTLNDADGGTLLNEMKSSGKITLALGHETIELDSDDIEIRLQAKEGWAAAQGTGCVVVLATELTDELIREGYVRDLVRLVQERRKELDCEYTDRIEVGVITESTELFTAISENEDYVKSETLAVELVLEKVATSFFHSISDQSLVNHEVAGHALVLSVEVVS